MRMPQSFVAFASHNPKLNQHSTTFSPLNIPKSSLTHLSSQSLPFSSTSARPIHSASRIGKQLAGHTGGNEGISFPYSARIFPTNIIQTMNGITSGITENSTTEIVPPDFKTEDLIGTSELSTQSTLSIHLSFAINLI